MELFLMDPFVHKNGAKYLEEDPIDHLCRNVELMNREKKFEKGYLTLKAFLEANHKIRQVYSPDLFEGISNCCVEYNNGNYLGNKYCNWQLMFNYGLSPLKCAEFEFDDLLDSSHSVNDKNISHLFRLFHTPIKFSKYPFYIKLLEIENIDLIEVLIVQNNGYSNSKFKPMKHDEFDEFQCLSPDYQNRIKLLISQYKPFWLL